MSNLRHTRPLFLGIFLASTGACGGGASSSKEGPSDETKTESAASAEEKSDDTAKKPESEEPAKRTWKTFEGGKPPFTISGWEGKFDKLAFDSDHKLLSVSYKVKVEKKMKTGDRIDFKGTCKIGDQYYTDVTTAMFGLQKLEPGETKQNSTSVHALSGLPGKPEKCQITVLFIPGDDTEAYLVSESCFDGKAFVDGPCKDFAPKRPSGTAAKIQDLETELRKIKFGSNKGKKELWVDYSIVPGKLLDSEAV